MMTNRKRFAALTALLLTATLPLFAACSGSSTGQASPVLPATSANPIGNASTPLLYLAMQGEVLVYKQAGQDQKPIRKLTQDLVSPGGMWVDTNSNLWVADALSEAQSEILRFRPGATKPDLVLQDPNWLAQSVWVSRDGAVYVVNAPYSGNFEVVEYLPHQKVSKYIGDPNLPFLTGAIAGDSHGNLFVGGMDGTYTFGQIDELKKGSSQWVNTGISGVTPYSLGFDAAGNLIVTGSGFIWTFPPGKTKPLHRIRCSADCGSFAFNHDGTILWVVEGNNPNGSTTELEYPSGLVIDTLPVQGNVATSPDLYP